MTVTAHTDAEMLALIRDAIYQIVEKGSAAYTINGRSYTRQDIDRLNRLEKYYQARVDASDTSASSKFNRAAKGVRFREPT